MVAKGQFINFIKTLFMTKVCVLYMYIYSVIKFYSRHIELQNNIELKL